MRHLAAVAVLLCAGLCAACAEPAARSAAQPPRATAGEAASVVVVVYRAQDAGTPGISLPDDIMCALGTDEGVLDCATGTREGVSAFAPRWVAVDRIDLNRDARADWIVHGRHDCLRRGELADWWVYAEDPRGRRLLLTARAARSLEVMATRTGGFRDLRLRFESVTETMRYDGAGY